MALSAFDTSINSLESRSDSLATWLFWCTLLVVLGLLVEYGHDAIKLFTTKPFETKLLLTMIGGVLITVGVAGELIVQYLASGVEADLRSASHLIEAGLIKEAEDAKREAAGLTSDIAATNLDAARATERASKAEMDAARSLAVAERERLERVRLEAEVSPRRLSPEQRKGIAAACKRFAGHNLDVRSVYQGDVEAAVIARQIAESAAQGGLEVRFAVAPHLLTGPMLVGIMVSPGDEDLDFASTFVQTLTSDGKLENVSLGPGSGSALTIVQVGAKPIK